MKKFVSFFLLVSFLAQSSSAVIINGQLTGARFENRDSEPAVKSAGRVYYDTTIQKPKVCNGSACADMGGAGGEGSKNFVPNPSAAASSATGWTYSNVTGTRDTDAGDKIDGVASFVLSGATHPATMTTAALTLDDNTTGNCEFGILYKGDATKWQLELLNGSDVAVSTIESLTNETAWTEAYRVYPCATGYRLRLASNAANPALPNVGGYYWGKARHLGTVNQIKEWTSYACSLTTSGGGAITLNATSKTDLNCKYRDNGDSIDVQATFRNGSGGAASGAAGAIQVSLPTGKTPDTSKMPTAVGGIRADGFARFGTTFFGVNNVYLNGSLFYFERGDTGANLSVSDLASGFYFGMQARIPVLENRSQTVITPDKAINRTGELIAIAGDCPANTIPATGKVIGKASGDYQGGAYYALYAKWWNLPGLSTTAGDPFVISSAKGATALADWDAGKTITVDFATKELFVRQDGGNTTLGGYQASQDKNIISFNYAAPSAGGFGIGTGANAEARPINTALNFCFNPQPTQPQPILTENELTIVTGTFAATELTSSGTAYDVSTLTLTPGVWLVTGKLSTYGPPTSWTTWEVWTGTTSVSSEEPHKARDLSTNTANARHIVIPTRTVVVSPGTTATIYLSTSATHSGGTPPTVQPTQSFFKAIRLGAR